jgi:hypothetical protein
MKTLVILNDPPYGAERSYNGLRLADADLVQGSHLSALEELTGWDPVGGPGPGFLARRLCRPRLF